MSSAKSLRYWSSAVTSLLYFAVMQSSMSVYNSIPLIIMCMPGISSSPLFCGGAWIASLQWIVVALSCIVFWCYVGVSIVASFEACVINVQDISKLLLPAFCVLWSHRCHGQSSSVKNFLGYVLCLALPFLCCYDMPLHLSAFYLQMLLATGLHSRWFLH